MADGWPDRAGMSRLVIAPKAEQFKFNDWGKSLLALGADHGRRRIRRAQAPWIARVRLLAPLLADMLDAATRKGAGRKKGR